MTRLIRHCRCLGRTAVAVFLAATVLLEPALSEMEAHDSTLVPEIIESETLDLLTLNVAHGRGTALNQLLVSADGHRENLERIASMLTGSGVHVAALQEADGPSLWSGRFDHVEFLTQATAFRDTVRGYHADSWLFSYGAVLMSRFRMTQTRSHEFQPSWPTAGKGFVVGSVKWRQPGSGSTTRQVTLASVHLDFSRESVRRSQIAEVISELSDIEGPLIVMGDFNADWSDLDSPVRELARGLGLQVFRPADRELGTYNDRDRLDWILISPELTFAEYTVVPDIVSDHLAVIARIGWNNQESPVKHE